MVTKTPVATRDRVRVVDDIQPNDPRLIELYRTADVFVLPTRAETFGIAAVEASAAGLPVVATRTGGLPEIVVDGVTGFVSEVDDARGVREALERLVADGDLRDRFGRAGRERAVDRFDGATNARRLLDIARAVAT
jgi:starch synthase